MKTRQLILAAALLVIALTPSVTDGVMIHTEHPEHAWLFWGWLGLAAIVLILAGEQLAGGS